MPMSKGFEERLYPILPEIVQYFGPPFHLYDESGIWKTGGDIIDAFMPLGGKFKEFFAVKANPNPYILEIMIRELGFGFDCSSIPELKLARAAGGDKGSILFTSNNTSQSEYREALTNGGCLLNLDDRSFIQRLPEMPKIICFRYNPGPRRSGNEIIGDPEDSKYGVPHEEIVDTYREAMKAGAEKFGIHTMICSNVRDYKYLVQTVEDLLRITETLDTELGIKLEFINMGGGLGIPYHPDDEPLNLEKMALKIVESLKVFEKRHGYRPSLFMESGRYVMGPHGVLVTNVINKMTKYHEYLGVDASMSALMRPALYGAYHHITIPEKEGGETQEVRVVGSLCENNDHFVRDGRRLPVAEIGDTMVIHDTGAHGYAMGFNYNGRLRPKELLLRRDGSVELIRRAETFEDYIATARKKLDVWKMLVKD